MKRCQEKNGQVYCYMWGRTDRNHRSLRPQWLRASAAAPACSVGSGQIPWCSLHRGCKRWALCPPSLPAGCKQACRSEQSVPPQATLLPARLPPLPDDALWPVKRAFDPRNAEFFQNFSSFGKEKRKKKKSDGKKNIENSFLCPMSSTGTVGPAAGLGVPLPGFRGSAMVAWCVCCPPSSQVQQPPGPAALGHGHPHPVSQQAPSAPRSSTSPVLRHFSPGPSKLLRTHRLAGFAWSRSTSWCKSSRFAGLAGFPPGFSQAVALPCLSFREFSLG